MWTHFPTFESICSVRNIKLCAHHQYILKSKSFATLTNMLVTFFGPNAYCTFNVFCLLSMASFVKNDSFRFYRFLILLICMDIQENPGPVSEGNYSLDIIHLNTRSIRNKIDYLSNLVESCQIACFSETHFDTDIDSNDLKFDGFDEPIRKDRNRNGGGIMVFMSSQLKYCRRHDLENPQIETIWLEIQFREIKMLLCCLYRSDFTASQTLFITEIYKLN